VATLFTRIRTGEIPGEIIFENEHVFAIRDIVPQAPVHVLLITKTEIPGVANVEPEGDHRHLLNAARTVAEQLGLESYRLVINQGEAAGQSVPHLHMHLLSGRPFAWPPG